ncbi:hypothetical protein FHT02_000632 [Sphingomonas xinjiangensis]|uniref:Uncharacterized protein n=1 Tax=Sphingomonas xinjiangensis TaxID=643568 RepID=A0A840YK52_9SPHN|nr:hypothetical protein [Sphingomonas xinjiangensis]
MAEPTTYSVRIPLQLSQSRKDTIDWFPLSASSVWSGVALEARLEIEAWLADSCRAKYLLRIDTPTPVEQYRMLSVHLSDRTAALLLKLSLN